MVDQIKITLEERITRGATLEEIEMIVLKSRGLRPSERRELWWYAWAYAPAAAPAPEPTLH